MRLGTMDLVDFEQECFEQLAEEFLIKHKIVKNSEQFAELEYEEVLNLVFKDPEMELEWNYFVQQEATERGITD